MKNLDVKSFVTITFTLTLILLLFITVGFKSEEIFSSVFLLFTNLCTAVFTYFFTKKKEETPIQYIEEKEKNKIGFNAEEGGDRK